MTNKRHAKLRMLSEGWEVEWCVKQGVTDLGNGEFEANPDKDENTFADFATHAEAIKCAKRVLRFDQYGSVRITKFHSERYEPDCPATFREYDGHSEFVEEQQSPTRKGE